MYDFYMIMKILPWFCLGILTITFVILEVLDFRRRGGQGGTDHRLCFFIDAFQHIQVPQDQVRLG